MKERQFPLIPKSARWLRPGDFWAVPVAGGRFACGRVIQVDGEQLHGSTRAFFGGLLDWLGAKPPTNRAIAGRKVVDYGVMHIRAITRTGGAVLGSRPLDSDGIEPPVMLSADGGRGVLLLSGARRIRLAKSNELGKFPVISYWGYPYITTVAEFELLGVDAG